jgi:hypothetical protein
MRDIDISVPADNQFERINQVVGRPTVVAATRDYEVAGCRASRFRPSMTA